MVLPRIGVRDKFDHVPVSWMKAKDKNVIWTDRKVDKKYNLCYMLGKQRTL